MAPRSSCETVGQGGLCCRYRHETANQIAAKATASRARVAAILTIMLATLASFIATKRAHAPRLRSSSVGHRPLESVPLMPSSLPSRDTDAVRRMQLAESQSVEAFRFVHTDDLDDAVLREDFISNLVKGQPPRGREERYPLIHEGLSMFKTFEQARDRRERILGKLLREGRGGELRIGNFVARLGLKGPDFCVEDRTEPDGHLTVWGAPDRCVESIVEIVPF